jgi:hypothetical protein
MNTFAKNARTKAALGIARTEFEFYRAGNAHWSVVMEDGEEFSVVTPNLGTESTVLRLAAKKLAEMGKAVQYPKGGA